MAQSLKVCVVGAGMSGLVAVKELLDEGHQVSCFERLSMEGGNFNHPEGAAYDSMYLTVSQYHMAFSSFPPPYGDRRRYWRREEYAKYLHDFGVHFGLFPHIKFNTEILSIQRKGSGKFEVRARDKTAPAVEDETVAEYDAVAVCSGAHAVRIPRLPRFEGAENFRGTIRHSATYRSPEEFAGKHVVCVGFGETAADVTAQIAEVAASCWSTFRRYPAVIQRFYGAEQYTHDSYTTRIQGLLPRHVLNDLLLRGAEQTLAAPSQESSPRERLLAEWTVKCGTPSHQPLQKNDDFVDTILAGKLRVHPFEIKNLTEDSVVFIDGTSIKADIVMCCTGYEEEKPPTLIDGVAVANVRELYKHVFHPELGARAAFIGWTRPAQGGIPACSEMQSRYFALLCSGKRLLPGKAQLRELIARDRDAEEHAFHARKYQATLVSYTTYMDAVAELVGCRPHLEDYIANPRLLYHLICGANIPTVYRLEGPHADPEMAKRVILSLPIAHSPRELATLGYLHVLTRLGLRPPPAQAHT